jgi:hypothetical protein
MYSVPDFVLAKNVPSCQNKIESYMYSSSSDYQNSLKNLAKISIGVDAIVASAQFTASTEFKSISQTIINQQQVLFETGGQCQVYELEMQTYDGRLNLTQEFKNTINLAYSGVLTWKYVIDSYGTHYVANTVLGGRSYLKYSMSSLNKYSLESSGIDISITAAAKYKLISGSASNEYQSQITNINKFNQVANSQEMYTVGGKFTGDFNKWTTTVKSDPMPIKYTLYDLTQLINLFFFPELSVNVRNNITASLNNVIKNYCNENSCLNPSDKRIPIVESEIPKNTLSGKTSWGNWGSAEFCPMNSYAIGYDLKIEPNQNKGDDTGLNSIALICSQNIAIYSNQGAWGNWRGKKYCKTNKIKGFQLKSEPPQGSKSDDTAANDLKLFCSDGSELNSNTAPTWGTWDPIFYCPLNSKGQETFICGLKTQVEPSQNKGDDTALNNVIFYCCS